MYEECASSEIGEVIFMFLMVTSLVGFLQLWHYLSQAPESRLPYATRPPPLPDPQPFSRLSRWSGLMAFLLSLTTYLEVDENDVLSYVGSGFGVLFDSLVLFLAVCSLVGFVRLFRMEQAPDIRRAHSMRPPPKPNPVMSATSRRRERKQFLTTLRKLTVTVEHRLACRLEGLTRTKRTEWSHDCWWRIDLFYSLPASWFLGHMTTNSSLLVQSLSVLGIGWLLHRWVSAVGEGLLKVLDASSTTQSGRITSPTSISASLLEDTELVFSVFRSLGCTMGYQFCLSCLQLGWSSWLQTLQWSLSWSHFEALYLTLLVGDIVAAVVRKHASFLNLLLGCISLCESSVWDAQDWSNDGLPLLVWLALCPLLPLVLKFIQQDVPSAWRASQLKSLSKDLETLLCGQDNTEWSDESGHAQSLTEPPPPLPRVKRIKHSRSWFGRLVQLCCLGTLLPWVSAHVDGIEYVAVSDTPDLGYGDQVGSFSASPMGWRYRRRLRNISKRASKLGSFPTPSPSALSGSSIDPPSAPSQTDLRISSWVRSLHPALEGRKWLAAEYMDKVVMQRIPPADIEQVSVKLDETVKLSFPVAVESVFNSLSRGVAAPLIIDSGASCCISPYREDFVTYDASDVKIKDLSGLNTVAGEGMLLWKVSDKFGREYEIQIKGYHIPHATVRLLSPQCILKTFPGSYGGQTSSHYILRLCDGTILEAPYGASNLPLLRLSNEDMPSCFWSKCFTFTNVKADDWSQNVLAESNKNLSPAQKELLRWHQRLSHAGLSTIHNLCRQKRSGTLKSEADLQQIRDKAILPCTFNVPSATCDGLLCAACQTAKAARRSPTIRPTTKAPTKEMVLKQGDLAPGDKVSCDHFISPVKGRVVAPNGYSSSSHGVNCGTLYVDHASGWMFVSNQKSTNAEQTIRGKLLLEREADDVGIKIKRYHADNGVFSSADFKKHCSELGQKLSFSGVGAKFQNGVAERGIQTVSNMARANMLHATMRWPGRKFLDLWPFAIQYAVWVHNHLPPNGAGWSPAELWSQQKDTHSPLPRAHVFGCPVYVLDAKLQDGKKIPKWDSRARQGIFVGFSTEHSTTVPLILNPKTQHISPQYHVIFDDDFSTVPAISTELFRNQEFERLFGLSRERYIDPLDAGADPSLGEDVVEPPSSLLDDEWLSSEDLAEGEKHSRAEKCDSQASVTDSCGDSASEGDDVPAYDWEAEGVLETGEIPVCEDSEGDAIPSLHDTERRPVYDASDDESECSVPPPPRRSSRQTRQNWRDGPAHLRANTVMRTWSVHSTLKTVMALSAVASWGQAPPLVSNAGPNASQRFGRAKIKHIALAESYLLQSDWSALGQAACVGDTGLFSAYFEPDLCDELGSYTITNVQPHLLTAGNSKNDSDSPSFTQAINGPFAEKWWDAMNTELETLEVDLQAWELVKRESWMNVLPSTWAFKLKRFPDGLVKKFKARFCVRGDLQKEGVDYFATWSPVVQWTTVRSLLILAANKKLVSAQADITAAFVHADLGPDEHIFVHQPAGFKRGSNMVLKLKRSVYGLKQAPRYFFKFLSKHLVKLGFTQSTRDPCLFVGADVIAVVYVDDILFFAKSDNKIQDVIDKLKTAGVAIRREGSAEGFLGVDISRSVSPTGSPEITFRQTGLTKRIIAALGLDSTLSKSHRTPAETSPLPKDVDGELAAGHINYPAVVGMLLYLSGHSRPDIAFAVSQVARYTFKPTRRHEQALVRIGKYLKGTLDRGMVMTPTASPRIDCYPDADFAGLYGHENSQDPHCARSRTGYVILAFGCPVVWRSVMQASICVSTMEAEYVALSTACKDLIPVIGIVKELSKAVGLDDSFNSNLHVKIHEDNVGALTLAQLEVGRMTPRSKHYAIKYHWFREFVSDPANKVDLVKVDTKSQLGDIFTKGLPVPAFEHLRRLLMGW